MRAPARMHACTHAMAAAAAAAHHAAHRCRSCRQQARNRLVRQGAVVLLDGITPGTLPHRALTVHVAARAARRKLRQQSSSNGSMVGEMV